MTKYLKGATLLLCVLIVPSLVAALDCESLGSNSSAQVLYQHLNIINEKQEKILQNQAKIKRVLLLMFKSTHLNSETWKDIEKELLEDKPKLRPPAWELRR